MPSLPREELLADLAKQYRALQDARRQRMPTYEGRLVNTPDGIIQEQHILQTFIDLVAPFTAGMIITDHKPASASFPTSLFLIIKTNHVKLFYQPSLGRGASCILGYVLYRITPEKYSDCMTPKDTLYKVPHLLNIPCQYIEDEQRVQYGWQHGIYTQVDETRIDAFPQCIRDAIQMAHAYFLSLQLEGRTNNDYL